MDFCSNLNEKRVIISEGDHALKKLFAVFLLLVLLVPPACADNKPWVRLYNSWAEAYFDVPQLDENAFYTLKEPFTGGISEAYQDGNCAIGFISNQEGENIGALCFDQSNDTGAFLVRCACLISTMDLWDERNFQILFFAFIHMHKDPSEVYTEKLVGGNQLIMTTSASGLAAYILGE